MTKIALTLSVVMFALLTGLLLYSEYWTTSGNHWFLFGTDADRVFVSYGVYIAAAAAAPLLFPLLFKRTTSSILCAGLGMGMFVHAYHVVSYLSD